MASALVLPSSKKQEHLEAGKRRLEEFRKKKAAEQAKKAAATSKPHASDASLYQKQPLESERIRHTNSDRAGTSNGPFGTIEPFGASVSDDHTADPTTEDKQSSLEDITSNPPPMGHDISFSDLVQRHSDNYDFKKHNTSSFFGTAAVNYQHETDKMHNNSRIYTGSHDGLTYGILSDQSITQHTQASQSFDSISSQSSLYGTELLESKENNSILKDYTDMNVSSHIFTFPSSSAGSSLQTNPTDASTLANDVESVEPSSHSRQSSLAVEKHGSVRFVDPLNSSFREGNFSSLASVDGTAVQSFDSTGFSSDVKSPSNHLPLYLATSETNSRKSRPSFLDSLNLPRPSSGTFSQRTEPVEESFFPNTSKSNGIDILRSSAFEKPLVEAAIVGLSSASSAFEHSMKSSVSTNDSFDLQKFNVNSMERKHDFYSTQQNEDFAALEQHIEDLTQEKFSLQRALEASRVLAESLAAENSSLMDSYNQQRSTVNELKSDTEELQEEIKAHLVELESVKSEYANAQLECNASDERAKLLAAEVIGLEEKALRLRSNELKLERELDDSQAEITSHKKKMFSLQRERQDLQSTIGNLQEEKRLLQSMLLKASEGGKSTDVSRTPNIIDVSTSTEDLDAMPDTSNQETHETARSDPQAFPMLSDNEQSNIDVSSVYVPPDHMRMIQNINALISELALEKEELIQALASESSQCSKLKDLNKELLHKLEAQTQRLELLTAQSMANENTPLRLPDSHTMQNTYADEGDEVVERVLGWIMKLFPGGPSRRRTSKLL